MIYKTWGEGWLGFPDLWSGQKPWWNWCLTPVANFGEVRRAKSTLLTLVGAPGIFSDLLRSVQMLKREGCRKQREATAPLKSLVKLQPWFLSLQWKTCLWQNSSLGFSARSEGPAFGQNTDDDIKHLNKCDTHWKKKFFKNTLPRLSWKRLNCARIIESLL